VEAEAYIDKQSERLRWNITGHTLQQREKQVRVIRASCVCVLPLLAGVACGALGAARLHASVRTRTRTHTRALCLCCSVLAAGPAGGERGQAGAVQRAAGARALKADRWGQSRSRCTFRRAGGCRVCAAPVHPCDINMRA
jgi:hypothetical protein